MIIVFSIFNRLYFVFIAYFNQKSAIYCFSLASKVRDEPLKSDFTIDLKHEVR